MPFVVTVDRLPRYVRFAVAGPASLKNYFDLIEQAARETQPGGDRLALVDLRSVVGRLHETDQLFIGDTVVEKLSHLQRVAAVVAAAPESYNSPRAAQNKGFGLRSFASVADAEAWLLGP
jgi:hypothetical protein